MPRIEDVEWGGTRSGTSRNVTLTVFGTAETLHLPVEVTTKVGEVKTWLAQKYGLETDGLQFIVKQSSSYRTLKDLDEIATKVTIKGLTSFSRPRAKYEKPICVIGAGHMGLRLMLGFMGAGIDDFVAFERLAVVGGTSWVTNANRSSKLQSELGVYHLTYAPEYAFPENSWSLPSWPDRQQLLVHFETIAAQHGIMPHIKFMTEVKSCNMVTSNANLSTYHPDREHLLVAHHAAGNDIDDDAEEISLCSAVYCCPGSLVTPKRMVYRNEEGFGGQIGYGMCNEFDYALVQSCDVAVAGMGAFGVENARTCLEHLASHVTIIARRKNLVCPRILSWFMNQSLSPPFGAEVIRCMQPMYDLLDEERGEEPWEYYAVSANKDQTVASIKQKSRFGISDVYFLAQLYGKITVQLGTIKRLQHHTVLMDDGQRVNAKHIIKVLGFSPHEKLDSMMQVKEMYGFWVNSHWRRAIFCEAEGLDANRFGGTSFSPLGILNADYATWFVKYPKDFDAVVASGMLPRHKATPATADGPGTPAHIFGARALAQLQMILTSLVPGLTERAGVYGTFNRERMLLAHPLQGFLQECVEDWNKYVKLFNQGSAHPKSPPYPYSVEYVEDMVARNDAEGQT